MTDNCFLCLEKAKKNMCPAGVCKMKCHTKCYRKYMEVNGKNNITCPVCKSVKLKKYNLRNRNIYKRVDKNEFIKRIKNFLFLVEQYNGTDNKKEIVIEMFEFIYYNLWFLRKYERFANVFKDKLIELYIQDNWNYANEVHKRLYGSFIR